MTDQQTDYLSAAVAARRLSPSDIEAAIASEHYFTGQEGDLGAKINDDSNNTPCPELLGQITFCVLILRNGTKVVGINYGAIDPAQHDAERGKQEARNHAIEQVWPLLGHELRSRLARPLAFIELNGEYSEEDFAAFKAYWEKMNQLN